MQRITVRALALAIIILSAARPAAAELRWVADTDTKQRPEIMRDDTRGRIYVLDREKSELVVLDPESEAVTRRVPLGGTVSSFAINKGYQWMGVGGGNRVHRVDLETFEVKTTPIPGFVTAESIGSVAFDHQDRLLVGTRRADGGWGQDRIMAIDLFGFAPPARLPISGHVLTAPLLRTESTGAVLYIVSASHTVTLLRVELSGETPVVSAEAVNDAIGTTVKDVIVAPYGRLYIVAGSPQSVQVLDGANFMPVAQMEIGYWPEGAATDPGDNEIVAISGAASKTLYRFDAHDFRPLAVIKLEVEGDPQTRGVALDRSDRKAFVVMGGGYAEDAWYRVLAVDLVSPRAKVQAD